jgi:pimeloyl-ACP methyl ester carboxylesterase
METNMANVFDLLEPRALKAQIPIDFVAAPGSPVSVEAMLGVMQDSIALGLVQFGALQAQTSRIAAEHTERFSKMARRAADVATQVFERSKDGDLAADSREYQVDAAERTALVLDTLRKRADIFIAHEEGDCPPVLVYDYKVVINGADLPRPTNYMLLKILPTDGMEEDPDKRPYMIIDPRAGHGPGIGGFKPDSEVGVALAAGHPVYFVAFHRKPYRADQTIADVTRAEAAFVREIAQRHPRASAPILVGNCQGGWAALLLAATNPDLTGPVVVNGAPVATWAGIVGTNPMRYNAGVLGGEWLPMFFSDLGAGIFDGAYLVSNFEMLNPSRTLFLKYTDLFREVDKGDKTFLEFERWWGGFFLLSGEEIRWIVEQLFVGNRLVKNEAMIEPGRHVDLKAIRAPIIVFASHGDNITPPQQALNWIFETYADVDEIRIHGQRIVYMVHEKVGHLGIFVSSSVARREHSEMATTLETIEALPPGLYEMIIEDVQEDGEHLHFTVDFAARSFDDLRHLDDGAVDEAPFAAVARASEMQASAYELLVRPMVKATATEAAAEAGRALNPQRVGRAIFATRNPMMKGVEAAAARVTADRHKAAPDNPWLAAEALSADLIAGSIDFWRDLRDMCYEQAFLGLWGTPWAREFGKPYQLRRTLKTHEEVRGLPAVAAALLEVERGGFVEAVIRMLVLLSGERGEIRRDRLERAAALMNSFEPFKSLGAEKRAMILHQQTLIAKLEPERAVQTLPRLLRTQQERQLAVRIAQYVPGDLSEMTPSSLAMLQRFRELLGLDPMLTDERENPLDGWTAHDDETPAPFSGNERPKEMGADS